MTPDVTLFSPTRAVWLWLRNRLRQRRCPHVRWTPLDPCPDCGRCG